MPSLNTNIETESYKKYSKMVFISIEKCKNFRDLTEHEFDTIIRTEEVYKIIETRIESVDPNLISKVTINKISEQTEKVHEYFTSFIESYNNDDKKRKAEEINLISKLLDELIIQISHTFQPSTPNDVKAIKSSIISARHSLAQHNRYIKEEYNDFNNAKLGLDNEINELLSKLNSIEDKVTETSENIENQMSDFEQTITKKREVHVEEQSGFWKEIKSDLGQSLTKLKNQVEEFEETISDKQQAQEKEYTTFQKKIESEIEKVSNAADDKLNDFDKSFLEKQQERFEHFSSFQDKWKNNFSEQIEAMRQQFSKKIKVVEQDFEEHKSTLDSSVEEHELEIEKAKDELYKLIEVAGNDVMSDGYAKYANKAAISKYIWQIASVIVLVALVVVAYSMIPSFEQGSFTWTILIFRSLLTASIGALAGFCIRQAHLSHMDEKHNREMQLKLGSIEPYLKNFSPQKRNEIKELLVADYFSKESNRLKDDRNPVSEEINEGTT